MFGWFVVVVSSNNGIYISNGSKTCMHFHIAVTIEGCVLMCACAQ